MHKRSSQRGHLRVGAGMTDGRTTRSACVEEEIMVNSLLFSIVVRARRGARSRRRTGREKVRAGKSPTLTVTSLLY